jgi:hypothetical protein
MGGTLASVGGVAAAVVVVDVVSVVVSVDVAIDGAAVVVLSVVDVAAGCGGAGFFASSGKIIGASQDQATSTVMDKRIATKMRFSMSGDRVPTSRIERMAAAEAADAQPDAAEGAVFGDGVHHVDRAGGLEAAHGR